MKKLLLISLLFFITITLFAHPHMFFANRYTLESEEDKLIGFWVDWIFDPYFSEEILFDFDLDQDGFFNETETQDVHDFAFINLAKYNYFQLIRQGNKRYPVDSISGFSVFVEDELLVYRFFVSLEQIDQGDVYLATYDPTFFCAIDYYTEWQVKFQQQDAPFSFELIENPDAPVYYDPYGAPTDSPIYDKWAPGLNTFIPLEVHLAPK